MWRSTTTTVETYQTQDGFTEVKREVPDFAEVIVKNMNEKGFIEDSGK